MFIKSLSPLFKLLDVYWWPLTGNHVVLAIINKLILNNVLQFCVGILMLCINCYLNNRNCRYYQKKVQTVMVNNTANINTRVPSQYLDFQRYVSWSLLWAVILMSDMVVCFVDIDGIVDHLNLSLHNHISHIIVEYKKDLWLSICCVSYNIENRRNLILSEE